mmetsp:Transcript_33819/g.97195  ORF Transcript_33819/g.97195 Transcript_33819/m.97195 type:complete len:265 (+) Transcript_33819:98-892(+)
MLHQTAVPTRRRPKATHPAISATFAGLESFATSPWGAGVDGAGEAAAAPGVAAAAAAADSLPVASKMLETVAATVSMAVAKGCANGSCTAWPLCCSDCSARGGTSLDCGGASTGAGVGAGVAAGAAATGSVACCGAMGEDAGCVASSPEAPSEAAATMRSAAAIGGAKSIAADRLASTVSLILPTICLAISNPFFAACKASPSACLYEATAMLAFSAAFSAMSAPWLAILLLAVRFAVSKAPATPFESATTAALATLPFAAAIE